MSRRFVITVNNYDEDDIDRLRSIDLISYCSIGKEGKEEEKTDHLQGYFEISKDIRNYKGVNLSTMMKVLKGRGIKCSIAVARGTAAKNLAYTSKEGDHCEWGTAMKQGDRGDMSAIRDICKKDRKEAVDEIIEKYPGQWIRYWKGIERTIDHFEEEKDRKADLEEYEDVMLRDWQRTACQRLYEQDSRKILYIWERTGNIGKTFLGEYLGAVAGAYLCSMGKKADMLYGWNCEEIIVIDIMRVQSERIQWDAVEALKSGKVFSTKYKCRRKRVKGADYCKVMILANFEPDWEKLSADRWDVMDLN